MQEAIARGGIAKCYSFLSSCSKRSQSGEQGKCSSCYPERHLLTRSTILLSTCSPFTANLGVRLLPALNQDQKSLDPWGRKVVKILTFDLGGQAFYMGTVVSHSPLLLGDWGAHSCFLGLPNEPLQALR